MGICGTGKTPLVFVKHGVKINVDYLKILKEKVLPWSKKHFGKSEWVFQQDSAPQRAKTVQTWCAKNFPDFISWNQWPPSSPDLNPMDFSIWNILKKRVCKKRHKDLKSLELTLKKEWKKLDELIQKCCEQFMKRIKLCVEAKGKHFEKN